MDRQCTITFDSIEIYRMHATFDSIEKLKPTNPNHSIPFGGFIVFNIYPVYHWAMCLLRHLALVDFNHMEHLIASLMIF